MKTFYLFTALIAVNFIGFAQFTTTTYRGAFAPAPTAMWTDSWTEFNPKTTVYPAPNVVISSNITSNTTWTTGNIYELTVPIYVKNNATLTIQPGVIVRGKIAGAGLFITRGAKLMAEGTATSPIVFTSGNDVNFRNRGDWGGIVLLGKGSYNINGGFNYIEGIAQSDDTKFGGEATPDDNDNSGTLKYVRIEFAGFTYGAAGSNTEINGLTMGACGKLTKIDYVQVSYSNDDSFEWFGGSNSSTYLVAFNGLDDDFDTDNGWSGNVQFCLAVKEPSAADTSDSNCFETDNNSSSLDGTNHTRGTFSNCTLIGPDYRKTLLNTGTFNIRHRRAAHMRRNTKLRIHNSIFMDFVDGVVIDGTTTIANANASNSLKFKNNIIAGTVTAKIAITTAPTTFDVATWFTANMNSSQALSAGLLTQPYNTTDGSIYTGLDYRPATGSVALTGADFTEITASLGTGNLISDDNLLISYPNPFTDSFRLTFDSVGSENINLNVYDVTGRIVETRNFDNDSINNQEFGNNYQSGMYILVLKQGDFTKSFRIIKR